MNRILVKGADDQHCYSALAKAGYPAQAIEKLQFVEIKQVPAGQPSQQETKTRLTFIFQGKPPRNTDHPSRQTPAPRIRVFEGYLSQRRFELVRASGSI
ncbi:hypothetical protein ACFQ4C_19925 [Larkinella insperata]|uniref:Uncharacterized protein n=1 Tax=Larkinella insperata TaxID=332158 RepID=A0ABW3Q729_9BACT|nr:hypothetical protein [Larkinella insperata]